MADTPHTLRPREEYIPGDLMRVVAMFFVVLIHISMSLVATPQFMMTREWWLANVINSACCLGVPVFIILSGALLLHPSRQESLSAFYRRRFMRVGIPTLGWSVIYAVAFGCLGERESLSPILQRTLTGHVFLGQYFLFLIVGLYVLVPFLRIFIRHASRRELGWAVVVAIGLSLSTEAVNRLRGVSAENMVSLFTPYVGYFLAGAYLRPWRPTHRQAAGAAVVFVAMVAAVAVARCICLEWAGRVPLRTFYWGWYTSPTVVLMGFAAFALLAWWQRPPGTAMVRLVQFIAPHTLGIFVVHVGMITLMHKLLPEKLLWVTSLWGVVVWAPVIFFASLGVTLVMRRIPLVRCLVG